VDWQGRPRPVMAPLPENAVALRFEGSGPLSESDLEDLLDRERAIDFDLARGPLVRARVLDFGPDRFGLVWAFHHILLDGAGIEIVLRDLFRVYDAMRAGAPAPALAPPVPAEYVRWLDAHRTEMKARSAAWWRRVLADLSPPAPFPAGESPRGDALACVRRRLTEPETDRLRALCAEHGLHLGTLLYGGWALCLAAHSGARDLVFAYMRSCRKGGMPGAEDLAALLMNALPLRLRLDTYPTLRALLDDVAAQVSAARPYQHSTLAELQRCAGLQPGRPLFTSVVVFNGPAYTPRLRRHGGRWVECARIVSERGDPGPTPTLEAYEHPALGRNLNVGRAGLPQAEAFLDRLAVALTGLPHQLHASPATFIEALRRPQGQQSS
jgi:condensation domain-containing protein